MGVCTSILHRQRCCRKAFPELLTALALWLCCCCCCLAPRISRDCTWICKSSGVSSCALLVPSQHHNKCLEIQWHRVHVLWQLTWAGETSLFCRAGIFPDGLVGRSTVWWLPLEMFCKLRIPCCVTKQNRFRLIFSPPNIFRLILDIAVCQILWMANTGRLDHVSFVIGIIVNAGKQWCCLFVQW